MTPKPNRRLRVLLDLSVAARGYSGIAQDARLLYKMLASCPELDVTGLIYLPRRLRSLHKFLPADAPRGDRLANQACFLWEFAEEVSNPTPFQSLGVLKRWRQLAATALAPRVQFDRLDTEVFWDFVWRVLFSPTLSADDIPLVQRGEFLLSNLTHGMLQARSMLRRRPLSLDTRGYDYLIVHDPRPVRLSAGTRQIVRYHDLVSLVRPDTIRSPGSPWVIDWHHRAIRLQSPDTVFVCNSEPTRDDLTTAYPELRDTSTAIPNVLSDAYCPNPNPEAVARIISRRQVEPAAVRALTNKCPRYIMCASTLEPRKNYQGLIQAFNMLKWRAAPGSKLDELKLVIVGSPGWKYEPILEAMRDGIARGELLHLHQVPMEEMRVLYTHAEAFVFPSNYEGFGFPPLEAMQCGAPVIASDIPSHRWVLGNAPLYCNPYDPATIANAIERLVASADSATLRDRAITKGFEQVKRYQPEVCARQWVALMQRLQTQTALTPNTDIANTSKTVVHQAA